VAGIDEATTTSGNEELDLRVELAMDLAAFAESDSTEGAEFRDMLVRHVGELIMDLGLPADPSVSIDAVPAVAGPFRICVAGRYCAPAQPVEAVQDFTPEWLADNVAGTIAQNRELCVTPAIAERLRQTWRAHDPAVAEMPLGPEGFEVVLTALVRRCVSVAPRAVDEEALDGPPGPAQPSACVAGPVWEDVMAAREVSLQVFVASDLGPAVAADSQFVPRPYSSDVLLSLASATLADLFHEELGMLIPAVTFEVDPSLGDGRFRIAINDLRFAPLQGLVAEEVMVNADLATLGTAGTGGRARLHPTHGREVAVVRVDDEGLAALNAQGHATWGPQGYIVFSLAREIRRHAGALLHPDVVTFHLDRLRSDYPVAVDTALEQFDRYWITAALRHLLDDQVSIQDLVGILEGLLAVDGGVDVDQSRYRVITPNAASLRPIQEVAARSEPAVDEYAECVRRHLRGQLTGMHTGGSNWLTALAVDERLEARLRQASARPLDEDERERLRVSVRAAYESLGPGQFPVVLTNSEVRRPLRSLLEKEFPFLPVVSRQELAPGTRLQWLNSIVWA
jgi:FHIPEP family